MKRLLLACVLLCLLCASVGCSSRLETNSTPNETTGEIHDSDSKESESVDEKGISDAVALEERQREYARLIMKYGLGLQSGQKLLIESQVENYEFTRMCEEAAYEAGAIEVIVKWMDAIGSRLKYLYADESVYESYPAYVDELYKKCLEENIPRLRLESPYPGLNSDINAELINRATNNSGPYYQAYRTETRNDNIAWSIAGVPNTTWAKKVFSELSEEEAYYKLWDTVLQTVYITGDGNGEELWLSHIDRLNESSDVLNSKKIKTLHYTNSLGTDLTVELPEKALWKSADSLSSDGNAFVANMPTEEVFTAPLAGSANGVIYASLPLLLEDTEINDIKLTVKDGKIVDSFASTGLDTLNLNLNEDEGSRYFGEISLVPYSSPISQMGILFYDTLYDENAACHIAFGFAFNDCIEGGENMTDEELKAVGLNTSKTHVDFMVGTPDLKIVGTTYDGEEIVIFENGNFAEGFMTNK